MFVGDSDHLPSDGSHARLLWQLKHQNTVIIANINNNSAQIY